MSKPSKLIPRRVVPARSKIAVQKSVQNMTIARKSTAKANKNEEIGDDEKFDKVFAENFEIAVALLPTVAFMYSKIVHNWISALLDPSIPKGTRNSYLSFLILQMQNMKIADPFDKEPPKTTLADPSRALSGAKMKVMMQEMDNKNLKDRLREGLTSNGLASFRTDFKTPAEFFDDQPVPNNGLIAYGGCFSNHFL